MSRANVRLRDLCVAAVFVVLSNAAPAMAQTIVNACYVPTVGALYVVSTGGPPAATACLSPTHTALTWGGAAGGVSAHSALTGLGADDHPQYLLANGVRSVSNGFAVSGTLGPGTTPPLLGPGIRMMWYPAAAAFRVGGVDGTEWDDMGQYSVAMGRSAIASGSYSFSVGPSSQATGTASIALGSGSVASFAQSVAIGGQASALAQGAVALGFGTTRGYKAFAASASRANANYSTALGNESTADGESSTAIGSAAHATGASSFAAGDNTLAAGHNSIAIGYHSSAVGNSAIASGNQSVASGAAAVALGTLNVASGDNSVALGSRASTNGHVGSFIFSDLSSTNYANIYLNNQFMVRAAGGVVLNTNAAQTTGCALAASSGVWACSSSRALKTDFADINGETILEKIRDLPVETWRYKNESPTIRHMGPYAEDFRAAFGLGTDSVTIGHIDESGVALAATKALEVRTRELREELKKKDAEIEALTARLSEIDVLKEKLSELLKRIDASDARRVP